MHKQYESAFEQNHQVIEKAFANIDKGVVPRDPKSKSDDVIRDIYKSDLKKAQQALAQYNKATDEEVAKEIGTNIYATYGYGAQGFS